MLLTSVDVASSRDQPPYKKQTQPVSAGGDATLLVMEKELNLIFLIGVARRVLPMNRTSILAQGFVATRSQFSVILDLIWCD